MVKSLLRGLAGGLLLVATLGGPAPARAQGALGGPGMLAPGTKRVAAVVGLGTAVKIKNSETQFLLTEELGFHLSGPDGLAVGVGLQEGFGDVFTMQAGLRAWYDLPVVAGRAIYLAPFVQAGWSMLSVSADETSVTEHYVNAQLGGDVKAVFNGAFIAFARLVALELNFGSPMLARAQLLVGGGMAF